MWVAADELCKLALLQPLLLLRDGFVMALKRFGIPSEVRAVAVNLEIPNGSKQDEWGYAVCRIGRL
jgi:hypothetical protein